MTAPILIDALCVIGLYVSIRMQHKAALAARGGLSEPSVVQSPRARITGIPNSTFGLAFYPALFVAAWFLDSTAVWIAALVAAALATAVSIYLAYSLLFVTRMPCAYCWTGHIVNWLLLATLIVRRV